MLAYMIIIHKSHYDKIGRFSTVPNTNLRWILIKWKTNKENNKIKIREGKKRSS